MTKKNKNKNKNSSHHHWVLLVVFCVGIGALVLTQVNDQVAQAQTTATLALSPSISSPSVGSSFNVNVTLNTAGNPVDGVDIYSIRFNPAVLQINDANASLPGVQISPGSLMTNTAINTVNNTAGTIQFSQSTTGGTSFTGSGTLATINFQATAAGVSAVTFDFTLGSTSDTNGSYTVTAVVVDSTPPTVSISSPTAGATVSGTSVTVAATASDNVGVMGVQFKVDGINLGSEDTTSHYSVTWNTTTFTSGSHIVTAVARDAAANTTTSSSVSVTVNNNASAVGNLDAVSTTSVIRGWSYDPDNSSSSNQVKIYIDGPAGTGTLIATIPANIDRPDVRAAAGITGNHGFEYTVPVSYQNGAYHSVYVYGADIVDANQTSLLAGSAQTFVTKKFTVVTEGRSSASLSGTLSVLNLSKVALISPFSFTTDVNAQASITLQLPAQAVYFKIGAAPFLTRLVSVDLASTAAISTPQLFIGDINQDNIINSVDFSILNINWFTTNASADLNQDGLVNAIDYSFMNRHWLVLGEQ